MSGLGSFLSRSDVRIGATTTLGIGLLLAAPSDRFPALGAAALWTIGLSLLVLLIVSIRLFAVRPRQMTSAEHRLYYEYPEHRPANLYWPGYFIPVQQVPVRRGLIAGLTLGAIVAFSVMLAPWSSPVATQAWGSLTLVLAVSAAVAGYRRIVSRNRHMTAEERLQFLQRPATKPAYLYWPGEQVPPRPLTRWSDSSPGRWIQKIGAQYGRRPRWVMAGVALVVVSITAVSGVLLTAAPAVADEATVVRIVDGDTLDVRLEGEVQRVRLLNIDTPELGRDGREPECLAEPAKDALAALARPGSTVRLEYDRVRVDQYGRVLAAVVNESGTLVNAAIAEEGLSGPVSYGDNEKYLGRIEAAELVAREYEAGIFNPQVACSPAAVVAGIAAQAEAFPATLPVTSAELVAVAASAAAVIAAADGARATIEQMTFLSPTSKPYFMDKISHHHRAAERLSERAIAEAEAARTEEGAAAAAEQARREEEARQAAEREAAERAAAEQAARDQAESSDSGSGSGSSGGRYPSDAGYTGCRDYSGVGMIDDQGRSFAPIPCPPR